MDLEFDDTFRILTFDSTVQRVAIPVRIIDDDVLEEDELFSFSIELVNEDLEIVRLDPSVAQILIVDNDEPGERELS